MKTLIIGFASVVLFYILSSSLLQTIHPPVWPDEAIYSEVIENVLEDGKIRSNLWKDAILNIQSKALWNPPMFFYEYAVWQHLWGVSITHQRLLVQIVGFINIILILLVLKGSKNIFVLITLLLWITNIVLAKSTRFARPEMFVLMFGLLGMYISSLAIGEKFKFSRYHVFAGIAFSMAILNHLIGTMFLIGLIVTGLWQRNIKILRQYAFISIVTISCLLPWLLDIMLHWSTFIQQFNLSSYPRSLVDPWVITYLNLGSFPEKIIVLGYIAITLFVGFEIIKKSQARDRSSQRTHLLFYITLLIAWILSIRGKSEFYAIYPLTLSIVNWGLSMREITSPKIRKIGFSLAAITLMFQIAQTSSLITRGLSTQRDYHIFAEEVRKNIPEESTVFLSAIPDPYFKLVDIKGITLYEFPAVPIERTKYIDLLNDSEYVVYTGQYETHLFGDFLSRYIELNLERPIEINAGGYKAHIFKLKNTEKRITEF